MKILIVTGIFPPDLGGPATYVPRIATALSGRHNVIAVVTLSDDVSVVDAEPFPVVRLRRSLASWLPRPLNALLRLVRVVATIRRLAARADVVYANGLVLETMIACKVLRRRRVVVKVVGDLIWEKAQIAGRAPLGVDEFQRARLPLLWRLLRFLQSAYMRRADFVITPSEYLARIVAGWGVDPRRIHVIYNSSDLEVREPAESPAFDLVTVARLVPWKGIDALIDVALRRGWSLKIVGEGSDRESLERRSGGSRLIRFAGRVPSEKVGGDIRSARIFVLNSSYEGLPHVALEAQAAGVAIVATNVGGTGEVVRDGETGVLVPWRDDASLERAIDELLASPARRRAMTDAAATALRTRFAYGTMVGATERVLMEASR